MGVRRRGLAWPAVRVDIWFTTIATSTAVIRDWARAQGLIVGDRGRLSPQVLDAYANIHDQIYPSAAPRGHDGHSGQP